MKSASMVLGGVILVCAGLAAKYVGMVGEDFGMTIFLGVLMIVIGGLC